VAESVHARDSNRTPFPHRHAIAYYFLLVLLFFFFDPALVEKIPLKPRRKRFATDWSQYGKGRHAAGLNFGDYFSYALAQSLGEPLLFKGEDFSNTDQDWVAV
jgi:uncharacterized protein with PIN domain